LLPGFIDESARAWPDIDQKRCVPNLASKVIAELVCEVVQQSLLMVSLGGERGECGHLHPRGL
jgi:hypothetical protein